MRRPNRRFPRRFTAAQIGKLVCRYLEQNLGAGPVAFTGLNARASAENQLRVEIGRCMSCGDESDTDEQEAVAEQQAAVATSMLDQLKQNRSVIAIAIGVLVALGIFGRFAVALIPRLALSALPVAARTVVVQVPGVLKKLQAAAAANEVLIKTVTTLQRAA